MEIGDDRKFEQVDRYNEQQEMARQYEKEKHDAFRVITECMQQCNTMGNNDSEFSSLAALENNLKENKISPQEAVEEANLIVSNKTDYH